jgi:predicted PurR-regulated permease PerM
MSFEQIIAREGLTIFTAVLAFFMGIVTALAFFSAFMADINTYIDKLDSANKVLNKINEKISKYRDMISSEPNETVKFALSVKVDVLSELYEELESILNFKEN